MSFMSLLLADSHGSAVTKYASPQLGQNVKVVIHIVLSRFLDLLVLVILMRYVEDSLRVEKLRNNRRSINRGRSRDM